MYLSTPLQGDEHGKGGSKRAGTVPEVTPSQRPAVQHPRILPDAFELQVLHFSCYVLLVGSAIRGNCARYVCLVTNAPSADGPSSHPRIPIESPLECPSNPPSDGAIRVHRNRGSDGLFCLSRR